MNTKVDDKDLIAAFAEFKELLKRDAPPPGASKAPDVTPEPRFAARGAELGVQPPSPPFPAVEHEAASFAPPPIYSEAGGRSEWTPPAPEDLDFPDDENRGRRRLIYLSVAIIIAGLAGLGWTLAKWRAPGEEAPVADLEPEQSAVETPLAEAPSETDSSVPAGEAPQTQKAELPPATEEPVAGAAPASEAAVPLPGVPVVPAPPAPVAAAPKPVAPVAAKPVAVAPEPVSAPPAAAARAVAPIERAPSAAAPPAATAKLTPATTPPANRFTAPPPETPAAAEEPATPKPASAKAAKTAKPKQAAAKKPPKPGVAPEAPRTEASAAPEPVQAAPPPPPPPPQNEGGAFGYMKRAVNSVGSTIGNISRSVIP